MQGLGQITKVNKGHWGSQSGKSDREMQVHKCVRFMLTTKIADVLSGPHLQPTSIYSFIQASTCESSSTYGKASSH
jgi:hypothetical protein